MICTHPGCTIDHDVIEPPEDAGAVAEAVVEAAEIEADSREAAEDAYTERAEDENDTREAIAQIEADAAVEQTRIVAEAETEQAQILADAIVDTVVVETEEPVTETTDDDGVSRETADDEPAAEDEAAEVELPPQLEDEKPAGETRTVRRGSRFTRRHRR